MKMLIERSKKILFVIDNLGSGGAQNQLTMLAVGLKEKGYEVTVFVYFPEDFFKHRLVNAGVDIIDVEKKDRIGCNVIRNLMNELKTKRYDVMFSYMDTPNLYAAIAKRLFNSEITLFISYRASTNICKLSWVKKKMLNWTNSRADWIVFNSNHERENWVDHYPWLKAKSKTIYNKVELSRFGHSVKQPNAPQLFRMLVVGTLSEFKNPNVIIKALAEIKSMIQWELRWVGRCLLNESDESQAYADSIFRRIAENGLNDHWEWISPKRSIEEEYLAADCLILASKSEGLPNVVCEALACGLPVIISNVLDHPILVRDGYNGYTFDPSDADSLLKAILSMVEAKEKQTWQTLSVNAKKIAQELFSEENTFLKYEELFKELA